MDSFIFNSQIFNECILHRMELTQSMHQDTTEVNFLNCLREIRLGECSTETERFMRRPFPSDIQEDDAVHIFFRRLPMEVLTWTKFFSLPGELIRLKSEDYGDTERMRCVAPKVLLLKPGCKVMLIWNKNETLKNWTTGTFIGLEGEKMVVDFEESGGRVSVQRETWETRSGTGTVVATRTQFPIIQFYGITCHKSQGLTLSKAVVHCSKEFVPGLMYVVLTRIRSSKDIRVLNFFLISTDSSQSRMSGCFQRSRWYTCWVWCWLLWKIKNITTSELWNHGQLWLCWSI